MAGYNVFAADSADTVRGLLDQDPFQVAGLITSTTLVEWNPVIALFAGEV